MKKLLGILALAFVVTAAPLHAFDGEEDFASDESAFSDDTQIGRDDFAWWQCSAQPPRLIRVFTVREEGYKSDVQAKAMEECKSRSLLQCWPLGCRRLRR